MEMQAGQVPHLVLQWQLVLLRQDKALEEAAYLMEVSAVLEVDTVAKVGRDKLELVVLVVYRVGHTLCKMFYMGLAVPLVVGQLMEKVTAVLVAELYILKL